MFATRFIQIQIYNAAGTEVEYDNTVDENWGITQGSMSLVKLMSEEELHFGSCNSSKFEVQVFGLDYNLAGRKIKVQAIETYTALEHLVTDTGDSIITDVGDYISVSNDGAPLTTTSFEGYIESSNKDSFGTDRNIIAYDWMYYHRNDNITDWWNNYWQSTSTSPVTVTIKQFREALLTHLGIDYVTSQTYLHDNIVITNPLSEELTNLTVEQALQSILELQFLIPVITGFHSIELISLGTTVDYTLTDPEIEGENSFWEDYTTNEITGIGIYDSSSELAYLYGTSDNTYKISGNIFLLDMQDSQLEIICAGLLNAVKDIVYVPASISCVTSNFEHKLGDRVSTPKGVTYVMQQEFSGNVLINETFRGVAQSPNLSNDVENINQSLVQGNKFAKITKTLDEFSVDYGNFKEDTEAKFAVTYNKIVLHVKANGHLASAQLNADPSGVADFKIQADNIDFIADDKIQLTSKSLGIYSTNFQVTPEGNVTCRNIIANNSGSIGGWQIDSNRLYYQNDNDNYINLWSNGKRIEIVSGGTYKFEAAAGAIGFYYNNEYTASIRSENFIGTASGSNTRGVGFIAKAGGSFIDLGFDLNGTGQSALMINNGLNPNGITDKIILWSTTRFSNTITSDSSINFTDAYPIRWKCATNDWAYISAGAISGTANKGCLELATGDDGTEPIFATQYTGNGTSIALVRRAYLLDEDGDTQLPRNLYVAGNFSLTGYVSSDLRFESANDYIGKGTWTVASTTYHGLYIARHLFTKGRIMSEGLIRTNSIFASMAQDVVIGTSSNNGVTGSNIYKGFGIYDNQEKTRFVEHYGAADTDGTIRGYILARNVKTDGTEVYNQLGCGVKKDGTLTYNMTSPTAFRKAISVDGIGETTDNNAPSAQTCNSGVWKSVATITSLPAGKYLLIGSVNIDANSNGNRYADISTAVDGNPISRHAYVASKNTSGKTALQMVCPINISSATTYHLNVYQDSGSQLSATGALTAIKIRG